MRNTHTHTHTHHVCTHANELEGATYEGLRAVSTLLEQIMIHGERPSVLLRTPHYNPVHQSSVLGKSNYLAEGGACSEGRSSEISITSEDESFSSLTWKNSHQGQDSLNQASEAFLEHDVQKQMLQFVRYEYEADSEQDLEDLTSETRGFSLTRPMGDEQGRQSYTGVAYSFLPTFDPDGKELRNPLPKNSWLFILPIFHSM